MKKSVVFGMLVSVVCAGCALWSEPPVREVARPAVVPQPAEMDWVPGLYQLTPKSVVRFDRNAPGARDAAESLAGLLRPATGFALPVRPSGLWRGWFADKSSAITFAAASADAKIKAEGYTLRADHRGVMIAAGDAAGFFYGAQTLRQLLPDAAFGGACATNQAWEIPGVEIEDAPRFAWRGLMLDEGRHFFGKAFVLRLLDEMALHKLNTFHWHLTEDQGWRLAIDKYPKLAEVASTRPASVVPGDRKAQDGIPYGPYFYTKAEIREIVAYAKARHIRVVPEIEMPGHSRAALSAYPALSCRGVPLEPRVMWGVEEEVYCAGNDETLRFLEGVLDEVCELFDSPFIHVGGDECPKARWKECPKCQTRMKQHGLKDEHELQSWFVQHFDQYLAKKGRRLIGWDEILEGGLAPGAAVMSWRGMKGGQDAVALEHDVVMTPTDFCYFDFRQFSGNDGYEYIGGLLSVKKVYAFDPCDGIPAYREKHVLGGQANLWSEYVWGQKDAEWKLFPRLCALSEAVWSPLGTRNYTDFCRRMERHSDRLARLGINAAPVEPPSAAQWKSGEMSNDWSVKTWNIGNALDKAGVYAVSFTYTHGHHRLDMRKLRILADGVVVASEDTANFTGSARAVAKYSLRLPQPRDPNKTYLLQAEIRGDGGSDSNGRIDIEYLGK
jgi:hexosaminidase